MSRYLETFTERILTDLQRHHRVVLEDGAFDAVVRYVLTDLAAQREGASLISALSRSLLSCPEVLELFADDDELRERINDLGPIRA